MAALKKSAIDGGFTELSTLLASGNVAFTAAGAQATVRKKIEQAISDARRIPGRVAARTQQQHLDPESGIVGDRLLDLLAHGGLRAGGGEGHVAGRQQGGQRR